MKIFPEPRHTQSSDTRFKISGIAIAQNNWSNEPEISRELSLFPSENSSHQISVLASASIKPQAYSLKFDTQSITLKSSSPAGAFYGLKTLRQLIDKEIAFSQIEDAPDFPYRGYYYDISRGKVPTLATLKQLADDLADAKLNQLQLYMEHTFAFKSFPAIWEGADPLTGAEIEELDLYCKSRYIELVPSLSTFGHFCVPLTKPRFAHLNELEEDASQRPFSWWDHMAHFTLDCQNPESIEIVRQMIEELIPHFSSDQFNICCDETFDLGKGRNKALAGEVGTHRLYIEFLKQVMDIVVSHGKTPMFWGDVITEHPEITAEIPSNSICLDWDYSRDLEHSHCERFQEAKIPFYICPGIQTWNTVSMLPDLAAINISRFAAKGKAHQAAGILTTDWGDRGHPSHFCCTRFGVRLAGAISWNNTLGTNSTEDDRRALLIAAARPIYLDQTNSIIDTLLFIEQEHYVRWFDFTLFLEESPSIKEEWRSPINRFPVEKTQLASTDIQAFIDQLETRLSSLQIEDPIVEIREIHHAIQGHLILHKAAIPLIAEANQQPIPENARNTADEIRLYESTFTQLWHFRNKPSEYYRLREALLRIATHLDRITHSYS
ncbi:MAG: family 20 glycosylhydrolase [Verrucomicrobiota bacterium]